MSKVKKLIICGVCCLVVAIGIILGVVLSPHGDGNNEGAPDNGNTTTLVFSLPSTLTLEIGESVTLTYSVTEGASVILASSDESVVTISGNTITAHSAGTATINGIATLNGKTKNSSCIVTIPEKPEEVTTYSYRLDISENDGYFDYDTETLYVNADYVSFTIAIYDNNNTLIDSSKLKSDVPEEVLSRQALRFVLHTEPNGKITFTLAEIDYTFTIYYEKL